VGTRALKIVHDLCLSCRPRRARSPRGPPMPCAWPHCRAGLAWSILAWLWLATAGRCPVLPGCPPHVARVGVNSISRLCSGPAPLLASRPPTHARHSLTAAHVLVCPLCVRCLTASAPGSQLGGDLSADSFLPPSATMAAGPRGSVVAWWSHLGPIRLARRFAGQCPATYPHLASHRTPPSSNLEFARHWAIKAKQRP
jgi:hypothetical protein